jgi:hypothetical protein
MLKITTKMKYYWHFINFRYHSILRNDCLHSELRQKLGEKARFHEQKAISLLFRN